MKPNPRFFIFGYFGWFNAGDDAIGLSIVKELKKRYPDASFTITCNDRYYLDNFRESNISSDLKIIGFGALKILREVVKSDYFIIAGGTHFHDEGGLKFGRFKILLSFSILSAYARLVKKPPVLLGHGIGPLYSTWSQFLVRFILFNSKMAFVRDKDSVEVVTSLGFGSKCVHGFDCTASLIDVSSVNAVKKTSSQQQSEQRIIGISLLPTHSIYSDDVEKDVEVIKSFTKCIELIMENDCSINIRLFAFRTGVRDSDISLLQCLFNNVIIRQDAIEIVNYSGNVEKFLDSIEECDFFIGMRYHASLFAYLYRKPQVILDYMGKCSSFGKDVAIDETAIIPIADILIPGFCNRIQSRLSNPDQCFANLPVDSAKTRAANMFETLGDIYDKSSKRCR